MCGIAAIFRFQGAETPASALAEMTAAVAHRGPDGVGVDYYALGADGLHPTEAAGSWTAGLGHRRLSILDLSAAGRQPMAYGDQLWITYNGEIFNFVEIRNELERPGHTFRSHSDTEVILAAYQQWGADAFARFRGMWGLVILDGRRRKAILCRDHLGIKPLYFVRAGQVFAVASEIKQFTRLPALNLRPNSAALWEYVLSGYEDSGQTFFQDVLPLPAGTYAELDLPSGQLGEPQRYWFPERVAPTISDRVTGTQVFRDQLQDSVRIHLRSDVPVGCALSGGLDSSSLAACILELKQPGDPPLHTFSVTFPGHAINEQQYVQTVTSYLSVVPHAISPTADELLADLDQFVWHHDEPVGSVSQYAAYAVARLTRANSVPVTLNGQGGDEVLAGYWQSYFVYLRGLARRKNIWQLAKQLGGALTPWGNFHVWGQIPVMLRRYRDRAGVKQRAGLNAAATASSERVAQRVQRVLDMSDQERRVYEIRELHLPRLLKWDDRNFMAFAVEGRYPFLDPKMIETCLSLAPQLLYARGWTKEPLRRAMTGRLPASIVRRRTKFGFETPQIAWMLGALRPVLEQFVRDDSPLHAFVDANYLQTLAAQVWANQGRHGNPAQELFRLFLADRWLRRFALDVSA